MNLIKTFSLIVSCLLLMTACSNDDSPVINSELKSEFVNPMSHIGNIHNQALDAISSDCVTLDSICSFTYAYIEDRFSGVTTPIPQMNEFSNKSLSIAKKSVLNAIIHTILVGKARVKQLIVYSKRFHHNANLLSMK